MIAKFSVNDRKYALRLARVSHRESVLRAFETFADPKLALDNWRARMLPSIPWNGLVTHCDNLSQTRDECLPTCIGMISDNVAIKHFGDLSHREIVVRVQGGMFTWFFIRYCNFVKETELSNTPFVRLRKRQNFELIDKINDTIAKHCISVPEHKKKDVEEVGCMDAAFNPISNTVSELPEADEESKKSEEESTCQKGRRYLDEHQFTEKNE